MGWSTDELEIKNKQGMDLTSKILLGIIACIIVIILVIVLLLMTIEQTTYTVLIDNKPINVKLENLLTKIDNVTYINIEEFAKLVGYEYHHDSEYKGYSIEKNKCYVQRESFETASFYLNENKVYKLPVDNMNDDYREFVIENIIKSKQIYGVEKLYAPLEAISVAFNVSINETDNQLKIFTLDFLIGLYDANAKQWGYTGIIEQSFESQKSVLYGYLIVKKEGGLYKIINIQNTKEIVPDKYTSIEFSENTNEFLVTNTFGQVGIINTDGTIKIEPIYDSIEILDKNEGLYLVSKNNKFGIVKSGNTIILSPEYDKIGIDTTKFKNIKSKYTILDEIIPVCKNNKWGAIDKEGKIVIKLEYDEFGSSLTSVEIKGNNKSVEHLISIEKCNGIIVKKDEKYGIIDIKGNILVPIVVDAIYSIEGASSEESKYFMLYNGEELNVIERLILAGVIEEKKTQSSLNSTESKTENIVNIVETNQTTNSIESNIIN